MSLVRIKNITVGKLVFLAVRDFSGEPLTLEAGEEKEVFPSMASQPSIQRVLGTKVLILEEKKEPVKELAKEIAKEIAKELAREPVKAFEVIPIETPVPIVEEPPPPEESPLRKTRRGRR